jgi:ABC-type lipoprotein release transport system permease subunit
VSQPGASAGFEVIGVVPDTRTSVFSEPRPLFYQSFRQAGMRTPTIVVWTTLDPTSLLPLMQRALRDLGGGLPMIRARTMAQHAADSFSEWRAIGALLGGLGALGLGMASLGLYAIVAFAVTRRAREIGVRMALDAPRSHVLWTVSRSVASLLAVGVSVGLGLSWVMVQGAAAISSGASAGGAISIMAPRVDPGTFVLVAGLMAAVGLVATFFPARRAARADPLVALRHL